MTFASGQRFTINSRKYDGSIRRTWECDLVRIEADVIDLVGVFTSTVDHPDLGQIAKGTISRERFYMDRWYNYFIFEEPAATFRNYYFNICMPPTLGDCVIDYVDLDIDLILWPDGRLITLDLEEFEANAALFGYPRKVEMTARNTLKTLQALLAGQDPQSIRRAAVRL